MKIVLYRTAAKKKQNIYWSSTNAHPPRCDSRWESAATCSAMVALSGFLPLTWTCQVSDADDGEEDADGMDTTAPAFVPPTSADVLESKCQQGPYAYGFTSLCEADPYNREMDCWLGGDGPHGPLCIVKVRD